MKYLFFILSIIVLVTASCGARADSVGYYFLYSNELIDLPYPGDTFYGEVDLYLPEANHLEVYVNPFSWEGENDYLGNYILSPLVPNSPFGVQQFAMDSELVVTEEDWNDFVAVYDIGLPESWEYKYNGQIDDFGRFEFSYNGSGSTRQDPLLINISPKQGADLTGYEFDTVFAFVEQNNAGYYFAAHIAGFTTNPSYWDNGNTDVESGYFAVGEYDGRMPVIIPEPAMLSFLALSALGMWLKSMKRK